MNNLNLRMIIADASKQNTLSDEQKQFFLDNGFLIIKNVLQNEELRIVQDEMQVLLEKGMKGTDDSDYQYGKGSKTGANVLRRVEYVVDKSKPLRALMGHPFIMRSVEKIQGPSFIPTWDSMVIKMPDEGIIVPWHRDAELPEGCQDPRPIFNVDFYLDPADIKSCLWVIPGSNQWTVADSKARCEKEGFDTSDAIPVPLEAGDAILHDITVLHGSPAGDGNALRRTVYFEFRPGEIELEFGPHTPEYLALKQQMLMECLDIRKEAEYAKDEEHFEYRPEGKLAVTERVKPETFRYPHEQYWIND
ncbi:phytanoyl-CoA dioxygenase family protein [Paenibacillus lemnae]|uniref:Phytanoyl-CoA dioxygenase family protein n=1 Tax=Paenibacillus lemnae TaxID=1330551 RepID=A0A848M3V6_PAELE|nr:phytanoyl-CoA dioxygenase family protein [Paenibacillus lemnae]NMO94900.1 phytanoyl-CoA dioxygenase family protein [Paenibacillus lemnae]